MKIDRYSVYECIIWLFGCYNNKGYFMFKFNVIYILLWVVNII